MTQKTKIAINPDTRVFPKESLDKIIEESPRPQYILSYDTEDFYMNHYVLGRRVKGNLEILIEQRHRITRQEDKIKFESEVALLTKLFSAKNTII